jgi:hypothetical protein
MLFLNRGATYGELAGVLGMTRREAGRVLRRLLLAAADPKRLALVSIWPRLTPDEQRLAYLNLILEIPLQEISHLGLIETPQPDGRRLAVSRSTLNRRLRQIDWKVRRAAQRRKAGGAATATPQDR